MYHQELDGKEIAQKIASELTDAANRMDFDPKAFASAVRREHRSIQQSVFTAVVALLDGWAQDADTNNFDKDRAVGVLLAGHGSTPCSKRRMTRRSSAIIHPQNGVAVGVSRSLGHAGVVVVLQVYGVC